MQGHSSKESDGRRPLIVPVSSRHMLQEVNKSLSNAVRVQQQQQNYTVLDQAMQIKAELGVKAELSKSTPNLADKAHHGRSQSKYGYKSYNQMAMAKIKQSLAGFQISSGADDGSLVPNGYDVESAPFNQHMLRQLMQMGCDEYVAIRALKLSGNKSVEAAVQIIQRLAQPHEHKNGFAKISDAELQTHGSRVIRKPSFENKYYPHTDSPIHSENSSVRSDSPITAGTAQRQMYGSEGLRYVPNQGPSTQTVHSMPYVDRVPGNTPPVPPRAMVNGGDQYGQVSGSVSYPEGLVHLAAGGGSAFMSPDHHQMLSRRMSPVPRDNSTRPHSAQSHLNGPVTTRGLYSNHSNSPLAAAARQQPHSPSVQPVGMMVVQERTSQQSAVSRLVANQPPPPYGGASRPQSAPTQPQPYLVDPAAGLHLDHDHSPLSSHSSSPGLVTPDHFTPKPVQAWNAKQPHIFMHQVRSREVQKPVLQTATAPLSPLTVSEQDINSELYSYVSSMHTPINGNYNRAAQTPSRGHTTPSELGSRYPNEVRSPHLFARGDNGQLQAISNKYGTPGQQQQQQQHQQGQSPGMIQIHIQNHGTGNVKVHQHPQQLLAGAGGPGLRPESPVAMSRMYNNNSPLSVISTTSTPSTNSDMVDKPPPPYPGARIVPGLPQLGLVPDPNRYMKPVAEEHCLQDDQYSADTQSVDSVPLELGRDLDDSSSDKVEMNETHHCTSPKPERGENAAQRDLIRQETNIKHFSSQACKFYMEQHFENVIKMHKERTMRRMQLEKEMDKISLSEEARQEMRKMLHQKESNYIRLKRAKMDKSMFVKVNPLGIGAFGEVALVYKRDSKQLLAMKTLRKSDVYQRNQVAHVKAERDILAEADNEWVVKLYYSFQDESHLYFVMDYIPGGDMMSLLIKFGIFEEQLAKFYIAELVLAIESVHKMGFIHRDIKPDNILIDRDGHIKLTDFGLCTGFRWTHSSKIYQNKGNHAKQDSMEPDESWGDIYRQMDKEKLSKPLERRQLRQRSQAHSLVGTPNYIAPEVLLRHGYSACCDWWSVGVILYEMLVGQPPFWANSTYETQIKVINYEHTLHIPPGAKLSSSSKDLIWRLCTGPENRLGRNGAGEIKKHMFFAKLKDMESLRQQPAPYKPTIRYPEDTSNFDPIDPKKLHSDDENGSPHPKDPLENGKHPEHAFFEFTFRRFFDDGGNSYAQGLEDPHSESSSPVYV